MSGHAGMVIEDLTHVYEPRGRPSLTALDEVGFEVAPGEVVGLLGPNGAGKTTCVRILSTLLLPTKGRARVGGMDVVADPKGVRACCGVSFGGDLGLYTRLSARDNLRYFATMYRLDPRAVRPRIDALLEQVGLADRAADRVETFSRGMRQRLHLARAVLHDPPVLMLDEPSAGLDPEGARDLRTQVARLAGEGRAILLTTHDMAEAEELCSRVVLLHQGRIRRHASPGEIREEASRRLGSCVEVQGVEDVGAEVLDATPGLIRWEPGVDGVRVFTAEPTAATGHLLDRLGRDAIVQVSRPSLVEAYLELMGDPAGEGASSRPS